MPILNLFNIKHEGDTPELDGGVSFEPGETFATFRERIVALQMYSAFDFWDLRLGKKMNRFLERGNKIEDYDCTVCVLPLLGGNGGGTAPALQPQVQVSTFPRHLDEVGVRGNHMQPSPHLSVQLNPEGSQLTSLASQRTILSSIASNPVSVSLPLGNEQEEEVRTQSGVLESQDVIVEVINVPAGQDAGTVSSHECFQSTLLAENILLLLKKGISKLEGQMRDLKYEDHRWRVKTWDSDGEGYACLECLECDVPYSCASKGVLDKQSITQCLGNYKNHHVQYKKHHSAFCLKRKLPVNDQEVKARMRAASLDDKAQVNLGVQIMERVNSSEDTEKPTFYIIGDLGREPCYLFYYRVGCSFCAMDMALVPQQRNLEHNLREHIASPKHQAAVRCFRIKSTDAPLLTGRPGRPSMQDKRDVKQKTIHGYFGHDLGNAGSSSKRVDTGEGKYEGDLALSQLCWGLWRNWVDWNGSAREVKKLLHDQVMGQNWWSEAHIEIEVFCYTCDDAHLIKGLFRHKSCSRVSRLGGGFEDLTCESCHNIKLQTDFCLRVFREENALEKRGQRSTGQGRRLDYLTTEEIRSQAKIFNFSISFQRKKNRRLLLRICMLQVKVPSLRNIVSEAVNRKDLYKFCNSIVLAHRRGVFGGREALWDMLKDIAANLNRSSKHWSKGSKMISQALFQLGGRRVVDCLAMNLMGPSLTTLQRDRRGMVYFRTGYRVEQFQLIALIYAKLKVELGIEGDVPCMLAEDETAIKQSIRWNGKTDCLVGFCGLEGADHRCNEGLEIIVGDGEQGFNTIVSSFESQCIGSSARAIIVNPLHDSFPRLCIFATPTCCRFLHDWVRVQWDTLISMWNIYCRENVGPVIGHSSDGDSRRRKLMLQDYSGKGVRNQTRSLGWEGWPLSYAILKRANQQSSNNEEGEVKFDVYGLHDQDFIHLGKRIINPLDSPVKVMHMGGTIATLEHLISVYRLYRVEDHGLNHEDILRTDRQNWSSAQRLCSSKVLNCLKMLRERKDGHMEMTLGTEIYHSICGNYIDIFQNLRLTLRQKIVLCGKVSFFFRLWRLWCIQGNHKAGGNTTEVDITDMVPIPTFLDIQMSCHFVVYLVGLFRDCYPLLPVPLHLTGSDVCEQFFSKVGGMKGHERNYDFSELLDCATSLNRLCELQLTDGGVHVGKSHKKHKNIWMKLHPMLDGEVVANMCDYSGVSNDAEVIDALKEGLAAAQDLCIQLDMCPSTSSRDTCWFKTPWIVEAKGPKSGGWCDLLIDGSEDDTCLNNRPVVDGSEVQGKKRTRQGNILDTFPRRRNPPRGGNVITDAGEGSSLKGAADVEPENLFADLSSAETINLPADFDEEVLAAEDVRNDFQDCVSAMLHELDDNSTVTNARIDPIVCYNGRKIYKSTLVSQLVGNPTLSKDRLMRVRQSLYFNNLTSKAKDKEGARTMILSISDDCGIYFVGDKVQVETRSKSTKRKGSKKMAGTATAVINGGRNDHRYWLVGRVQKIRRRYGKTWTRAREDIDLLDRPTNDAIEGSCCDVLFNWFTPQSSRLKFKYTTVDPLWIELDSVVTVVSMTVHPNNPVLFTLDSNDAKSLDDFVKQCA